MKNLITPELAAKKNPATMKKLQGLSLTDLVHLQKQHKGKCDELDNEISYLINSESTTGNLVTSRAKREAYNVIRLLIKEAIDRKYHEIFNIQITVPSEN